MTEPTDRVVWLDLPLSIAAIQTLERSAITPAVAKRAQCRSVSTRAELPEALQWLSERPGALPGILYVWRDALGYELPQYSPLARPFDPKYSGPSRAWLDAHGGGASQCLALAQEGAPEGPVWIVEGTRQHMAAASHAPSEATVLGIAGCYGWRNKRDTIAGLEVVEDRQVVVCFDADASSNPDVASAATGLAIACMALGAADVRFVSPPAINGDAHTGLDDWLASVEGSRAESLAALMASATYSDDGRTLGERHQDNSFGKRVRRRDLAALAESTAATASALEARIAALVESEDTGLVPELNDQLRKANQLLGSLETVATGQPLGKDRGQLLLWWLVRECDATVDSVCFLLGAHWRPEARAARLDAPLDSSTQTELAHRLYRLQSWGLDTFVYAGGEFHRYNARTGTWPEVDEHEMCRAVAAMNGTWYRTDKGVSPRGINANDVDGVAKILRGLSERRDFFETAPQGIAFRNGFLRIAPDGTGTLAPHCPQNRALYARPCDYAPEVQCPTWDRFIGEIFGEDHERVTLVHQIIGYLMTNDTSLQKLFLFLGVSGSGKGTIIRVIQAILGADACASFRLSALGKDYSFEMQSMIGKSLAVDGDVRRGSGANEGHAVEKLLGISGEDTQIIQRKHKAAFMGKMPTRILLAANPPFGIRDTGMALIRRLVTLTFDRSFADNQDPHLTRKLIAELPGIVRHGLEGLRSLRASGGVFVVPASAKEMVDDVKIGMDPMSEFINEYCRISPPTQRDPSRVSCGVVYDAMKRWCKANGRAQPSNHTFGQTLRLRGASHSRQREEGRQGWYWLRMTFDSKLFEADYPADSWSSYTRDREPLDD